MITLDERSNSSIKLLFPLVAGMGLGLLLHAPYQVFTRALQSKDMAVGTSAFFLLRFTGATIGLVSTFSRTVTCFSHDSIHRPLLALSSTSD
jgi:hypothetical protein